MTQREFDFIALSFCSLERKLSRLLEIAENTEHSSDHCANPQDDIPDRSEDAPH